MEKNMAMKTRRLVRMRRYVFCYSFLAIALIHFAIFYVIVNLNSILMAFKQFMGLDEAGNEIYAWSLENFNRMIRDVKSPDSTLLLGLSNTLKYFGLSMFIIFPISLTISFFIYKKIVGHKFLRVIFYFPTIISGVVFITSFKSIISQYGPIYMFLYKVFNYQMPALLASDTTATATIIFYCFWTGLGMNMILFQGAMSRIPEEVIEAGRLDGITSMREFFSVTLPMIWPTLSMLIILAFTGVFTSGGPILLFSEAGVSLGAHKTTTLSFYIYFLTWSAKQYEYPAAIGIVFTVLSLPVVFGIRAIMSKIDPEVEY